MSERILFLMEIVIRVFKMYDYSRSFFIYRSYHIIICPDNIYVAVYERSTMIVREVVKQLV